jgi:predicted aspartyl protease
MLRQRQVLLLGLSTILWTGNCGANSSTDSESLIDLRLERDNHFYARVEVNGYPMLWLVDTGAVKSAIDLKIAQKARISPVLADSAYPQSLKVNGKPRQVALIQKLTSQKFDFGSQPVALMDLRIEKHLNEQSSDPGLEVGGILGLDILKEYQAVINCWTHELLLNREMVSVPATPDELEKDRPVTVSMTSTPKGHLQVAVKLAAVPASFIVDTGAALTFVSYSLANALGLKPKLTSERISSNFFGQKQILRARVDSLGFGDFHTGPAELAMLGAKPGPGNAASSSGPSRQVVVEGIDHALGGFLGTDLLTKYHAIIDIGQMTLSLKTSL